MGKDYQAQYDQALEVLEVVDSEGFQVLMEVLVTRQVAIKTELDRHNKDVLRTASDGNLDSERHVQKTIALQAELKGLEFISTQVELFRKKKKEASKRID